ncbi:MAG: hypothetical protein FJY53_00030 [Betaproteobacteria bacterium]|nr:hypothetical protein [Betaproteobacteria bacterium]
MWKFIFVGLVVWLLVLLFKRLTKETKSSQPDDDQSKEGEVEQMVQCATCHVHIPRSEAFLVRGAFYCSKAHIQNQ